MTYHRVHRPRADSGVDRFIRGEKPSIRARSGPVNIAQPIARGLRSACSRSDGRLRGDAGAASADDDLAASMAARVELSSRINAFVTLRASLPSAADLAAPHNEKASPMTASRGSGMRKFRVERGAKFVLHMVTSFECPRRSHPHEEFPRVLDRQLPIWMRRRARNRSERGSFGHLQPSAKLFALLLVQPGNISRTRP
jgi:hypothetical protein